MTKSLRQPIAPPIPKSMRVSTRIQALTAAAPEASPVDTDVSATEETLDGDTDHEIPVYGNPNSPIRRLANSMVKAADQTGMTPIIVPGACVSLNVEFFVSLSSELRDIAERDVRLEALSPAAAGWAGVPMIPFHHRCVQALSAAVPYGVEVVEMNRISRPAGPARPLFVGMATSFKLVRWLPRTSFYRLLVIESNTPTVIPFKTDADVQRIRLSAVVGGA